MDNNWYEGRLNHIEGIFPADYVETLREPKGNILIEIRLLILMIYLDNSFKQSNQNEHAPKLPKSVLKNTPEFQQSAIEKMNIIPRSLLPTQKYN